MSSARGSSSALDLVAVPGGTSVHGSDEHYPEERPARSFAVGAFQLARTPVTVGQFAAFVHATGHVTRAELAPSNGDHPDPDHLVRGSNVFTPPAGPVDLRNPRHWWSFVAEACWSQPEGPGSAADPDLPVVHVTRPDALAYCAWGGLRLPTEHEWEHAALLGGGDPGNIWAGAFPWRNDKHRPAGPEPAEAQPVDRLGLHGMLGNTWELVDTDWSVGTFAVGTSAFGSSSPGTFSPGTERPCCGPAAAHGDTIVAKGGSFLCSPDYCARYRPAARIPISADSPTGHVGFRCAL